MFDNFKPEYYTRTKTRFLHKQKRRPIVWTIEGCFMGKYKYIYKSAWFEGKKYVATGKTENEAILKLAEKLSNAKRGEETISGSMTVNAWYKQWKSVYKDTKKITPKSLGMYDEKYNGYINAILCHFVF